MNVLTIWMPSWCNAVGVVLLIARGWRGTSLPRVNIRKEIQRHRCWAFFVKSPLQWTLLWQINQKKHNIYGVVPHKPYVNPGLPALSFGTPGLSKTQHRWRWNIYFAIWITLSRTWIYGELRLETTTLTASGKSHWFIICGAFHWNINDNVA